jgi:uncharacterized protein YxjI
MDVLIQERKLSLWMEYDITAPGRSFHAKKEMLHLFNTINLEIVNGPQMAKLQGKFAVLGDKYEFDMADGRKGQFQCTDRIRSVFECRCGSDVLTLYEHRGMNRSIFNGDRQVAAYTKTRFAIGMGHRYDIRMDADADLVLIVCMVLALSVSDDNMEEGVVSLDIGKIGLQAREYDAGWVPR